MLMVRCVERFRGVVATSLLFVAAVAQGQPAEIVQMANSGNAEAQRQLGWLYSRGEMGTLQSDHEAALWFLKAAEQSDVESQRTMGLIFTLGKGVPRSLATAAEWFKKAAEQGDFPSQYSLGSAYFHGFGIPQNFAKSYFWLNLSIASGLHDPEIAHSAVQMRDAAVEKLSREELSRLQEEAGKWRPKQKASR